jgi:hypothetical protein
VRLASHREPAEQARNDVAEVLQILAQRREETVSRSTLQPSLDFPAVPLPSPIYEPGGQ